MPLSIEELKRRKADVLEAKKLEKSKPKPKVARSKKERHKKFTDGGEEQWDGSIAFPLKTELTGGRVRYDTYQLDTGEWSFSPESDGPISLYGARANRAFGWDGKAVVVKIDADHMEVWWNDAQGVQRGLASSTQAIEARQRYCERMNG